jgi:hypothetical protein
MAKLFRTNSNRHLDCYGLQKCEDILVADAYLDIKEGGTDRHEAILKFLDRYWLNGQGLSDRTLIWINDLRRNERRVEITFVDGHSSTYSLTRGEEKARLRKNILSRLQEIRGSAPLRYVEVLERARAAAKSLPSRDPLDIAA